MPKRRWPSTGLVLCVAVLAGCSRGNGGEAAGPASLAISFGDVAAPEVFRFDGPITAEAGSGAPGLWAAVPDLARAERGLVAAPGGEVVVALFAAPDGEARLSAEAAALLGIPAGARAEVVVTAVRRTPRIAGRQTDF